MAVAKNLIAVLLSFSSIWSYAQQDVELFNQGRTRCYFGGMSWAEEGRALFHTHNYVTDTTTGILNKIALTAWQNDGWKDAVFQDFIPGYSESPPPAVHSGNGRWKSR